MQSGQIQVRDLRKTYRTNFGQNVVLDGVNFDLAMGERLGILGRNGAGKSTMIRLISGAERQTSGTVETTMSVSWPLAFGGAFQPNLTGLDNIRFISRIYNQDIESNLAFVEEFAELGPYLAEEVRTYSSGMRARLAFAISMIIEFDCFLIDEIGAVGDARFHDRCNQELFRKRSDRAMIIISHDASYIRDHCTRFAVLHGGKLELFAEFDDAYSDFRTKIGLEAIERPSLVEYPSNRRELIETTHTVAVLDDVFRAAVQAADWNRDDGQWAEAEAGYKSALELYPYQRSYWVQAAHAAKEAGEDTRAEIGYRTAIALGETYADVREHFEFVLARQGLNAGDLPPHIYSGTDAHNAAPAAPDISTFARAAWSSDEVDDDTVLDLLRHHSTCDSALAAMIRDDRFDAARTLTSAGNHKFTCSPGDDQAVEQWIANLIAIASPGLNQRDRQALAQSPAMQSDPWSCVIAAGGFANWRSVGSVLEQAA
ncbi:ATP-binding cassette domain-containing protein [Erythrobacter sp. Alg231-14]|uniref:ATP-binding cassette domain-containing protein n=1 Tax=Erythrobacter sp. Alg231-14 TaxID=1922225 RepID=UPI000D54FA71